MGSKAHRGTFTHVKLTRISSTVHAFVAFQKNVQQIVNCVYFFLKKAPEAKIYVLLVMGVCVLFRGRGAEAPAESLR